MGNSGGRLRGESHGHAQVTEWPVRDGSGVVSETMSGVMAVERAVACGRDACGAGMRAAVIAAVAGRVMLGGVWAGGGGQPLAAASVLSFAKAASNSAAHGHVP